MSDNWIQSVRLPMEELQRLLDDLDKQEAVARADLRRSPRKSYRCGRIMIRVLTGHFETESAFQVTGRNISGGGLAFLHGQAMPVDTRLRLQIPLPDGRWQSLVARVVRCRHVKGMIHEVAVQFLGTRAESPACALDDQAALAAVGPPAATDVHSQGAGVHAASG